MNRPLHRMGSGEEPMKRTHSREFKLQVARELLSGEKRISQVCRENDICETLARRWKEQYPSKGEDAFQPTTTTGADEGSRLEARIRELEASLGRAHLENEFLRAVLSKKGSVPERKSP